MNEGYDFIETIIKRLLKLIFESKGTKVEILMGCGLGQKVWESLRDALRCIGKERFERLGPSTEWLESQSKL